MPDFVKNESRKIYPIAQEKAILRNPDQDGLQHSYQSCNIIFMFFS